MSFYIFHKLGRYVLNAGTLTEVLFLLPAEVAAAYCMLPTHASLWGFHELIMSLLMWTEYVRFDSMCGVDILAGEIMRFDFIYIDEPLVHLLFSVLLLSFAESVFSLLKR